MDTARQRRQRPPGRGTTETEAHAQETISRGEDTFGHLAPRLFQLFDALQALANLADVAQLVEQIPAYAAYRVDRHLASALANLTQVAQLWQRRQTRAVRP